MKTRLFIGNLAPSVTEAELKDKFDKLLADHKEEAEVGSVEVKVKNEDNYFGYVDVHTKRPEGPGNSDIPQYLRKYIEIMNNTKWKGSLIKVQIAKESFMQKLLRERKEAKQEPVQPVASFQPKSTGPPTEISRNQKQASEVLHKLNLSKRRRRAPEEEENPEKNQFDFEVVTEKKTTKQTKNEKPEKVNSVKVPVKTSPSPVKKSKKKESSSESSSDDDDEEEQRDVPKFKGLLFNFPNGIPVPDPVASKNSDEEEPKKEEMTLKLKENEKKSSEKEDFPKENGNTGQNLPEFVPVPAKGITFKKSKQQQSDLLRIQSLEKTKELKEQQKNLIKSSLAKVPAVAPVTQKRKILNDQDSDEDDNPAQKKMSLFDDDEGSDNDEDVFTVKKQFEGSSGQKLLELKTRWGNDSRFQIDDRFKEDDGKEVDADDNEKEKQLNILTSIFGKEVGSKEVKKGPVKKNLAGVIAPRYDPEADNQEPEQEPELEPEKKVEKPAETQEKVIRSVEPATYKTAANLKSLFSSVETEKTPIFAEKPATFSLLRENSKGKEAKSGPEEEEGPRKFWEKNPFKYDSSDDENEELPKKDKEKPKQNLVVHGKTPFFFTLNDARFVDVEEFFLKKGVSNGTEDSEGKKDPVEDFSVKRQELKSIVKAKIKNSKRKDEKRTLAIKRAMRKRKSKKMQTQRKF